MRQFKGLRTAQCFLPGSQLLPSLKSREPGKLKQMRFQR